MENKKFNCQRENLLVSQMGYEIEMRSIPDRLKNEIKVIIWKLIWDDKENQIDRNVFLFGQERGWNGNDKY